MSAYIDGFIIPVPKKNLKSYRTLATKAAKIWKEYGALEVLESVADDVEKGKTTSFPRSVKLKKNETVVFSYVVFKSKADRDRIMDKVMKDDRMAKAWDNLPIDGMRMIYGGFKPIVTL